MKDEVTLSFNKKFVAGYLCHVCLVSLLYDWWGMEKTIAKLVGNWMPAKITVPLAILGLTCALVLTLEPKKEGVEDKG